MFRIKAAATAGRQAHPHPDAVAILVCNGQVLKTVIIKVACDRVLE